MFGTVAITQTRTRVSSRFFRGHIEYFPGFLQLPTELLLTIFEYLGADELFTLASLSRRLNYIVLPVYFACNGVTWSALETEATLSINLARGASQAIRRGVQIAFGMDQLHHLSCKFNESTIQSEIDISSTILKQIGVVTELTLDFGNWKQTQVWKDELDELLQLAFSDNKRCKTFNLLHAEFPMPSPRVFDMWQSSRTVTANPFRKMARKIFGNETRLGRSLMPISIPPEGAPILDTSLVFSKIRMLNASKLTKISLRATPLFPLAWDYILPLMHIPTLTSLHLNAVDVSESSLQAFLARHPSITTLELELQRIDGVGSMFSNTIILPVLTHLLAPPKTLAKLVSSDVFPKLICVTILCDVLCTAWDFIEIDFLLDGTVPWLQDARISVWFDFKVAGSSWMHIPMMAQHMSDGGPMSRMKRFMIYTGWSGLDRSTIQHFPGWLTLFPALEYVILTDFGTWSAVEEERLGLVNSLAERCAGLQMLTINSKEYRVNN